MRHDVAGATGSAQGRPTAGRVTIATPRLDAPDSMRRRPSGPMKAVQARLPAESNCSIAPAGSRAQGSNAAARELTTKARRSSGFLPPAMRGASFGRSSQRRRPCGQMDTSWTTRGRSYRRWCGLYGQRLSGGTSRSRFGCPAWRLPGDRVASGIMLLAQRVLAADQ